MKIAATLLAGFAAFLCCYFLATGLRTGVVEIFSKTSRATFARRQRPGMYWFTIAVWLAGMLAAAYYAVTWAVALAAA